MSRSFSRRAQTASLIDTIGRDGYLRAASRLSRFRGPRVSLRGSDRAGEGEREVPFGPSGLTLRQRDLDFLSEYRRRFPGRAAAGTEPVGEGAE